MEALIPLDALELIAVDYDPLPAVVEMEKALEPGAPVLHEEWNDNLAFTFELAAGDIDQALREAEVTIRQRILNQRLVPLAMESRGLLIAAADSIAPVCRDFVASRAAL